MCFLVFHAMVKILSMGAEGGSGMDKENRRERTKRFRLAQTKKLMRARERHNHRIQRRKRNDKKHGLQYVAPRVRRARLRPQTYKLVAPVELDICNKSNETVSFFGNVIHTIKQCNWEDTLHFDLSAVECISTDAVMYLIAIIKNMRRVRTYRIECKGNMPKNAEARGILEKAGFYSYVESPAARRLKSDERFMKISVGKDADARLASSFCDFVQAKCDKSILETKRLYSMLIELMTNTHQHAYKANEQGIMLQNWYVSAYATELGVRCVFLDTGVGIPATVSKKAAEKMLDLIFTNDAMYLKSALLGDFRSETREGHRGKGIPGIYEDACDYSISNLCIVSGKGKCYVDGSNIKDEKLNQHFEGTLFSWDIMSKRKGGLHGHY